MSSHFDPRAARSLMTDVEEQTRRATRPDMPVIYLAWGTAWLLGYLAVWLSTRDQDPYRGPAAWAYVVLGIAMLAAAVTTSVVVGRATRGINGPRDRSGLYYGVTWLVAFGTWSIVLGAVSDAGASAEVTGLLGGSMPGLLVAVVYCGTAAMLHQPSMFVVGVAVAVVTAVAAWVGLPGLCLVLALGGAAAFGLGLVLARRTAP